MCVDHASGATVVVAPCHGARGHQEWILTEDKQLLAPSTKKCLDATGLTNGQYVVAKECDPKAPDGPFVHTYRSYSTKACET
uniref:Ricin B lectin domain-containing protein n=1 Tax=Romanomermis culicivorax TaxID=13658 RepID=A0A915JY44_ROMCU